MLEIYQTFTPHQMFIISFAFIFISVFLLRRMIQMNAKPHEVDADYNILSISTVILCAFASLTANTAYQTAMTDYLSACTGAEEAGYEIYVDGEKYEGTTEELAGSISSYYMDIDEDNLRVLLY